MHYKELVNRLAEQTGISPKVIRDVLFALPDVLITMDEGEKVRMPFGTFRMTKRKARTVTVPTADEKREVPAQMVVKMRAGSRLRRKGS